MSRRVVWSHSHCSPFPLHSWLIRMASLTSTGLLTGHTEIDRMLVTRDKDLLDMQDSDGQTGSASSFELSRSGLTG